MNKSVLDRGRGRFSETLEKVSSPAGMPSINIFLMWESELTSLIRGYYLDLSYLEITILKDVIYVIRDIEKEAAPYFDVEHAFCQNIQFANNDNKGLQFEHGLDNLIEKGIVRLVFVDYEVADKNGILHRSEKSLHLCLEEYFLKEAVSIMDDVLKSVKYGKKMSKKNSSDIKQYFVNEVLDKRPQSISIDSHQTCRKKSSPSILQLYCDRPFSNQTEQTAKDETAQALFFLDKSEHMLDYISQTAQAMSISSASYDELCVSILEHDESRKFKSQKEIDAVLQKLYNDKIISIEIHRVYYFTSSSYRVSKPYKFIKVLN
jgi:hypothetical protein